MHNRMIELICLCPIFASDLQNKYISSNLIKTTVKDSLLLFEMKNNLKKLCRTCMKTLNLEITPSKKRTRSADRIHYLSMSAVPVGKGTDRAITNTILELLQLVQPQITHDFIDELPVNLCSECVDSLLITHSFLKTYQESDLKFREYLINSESVKFEIIEELPTDENFATDRLLKIEDLNDVTILEPMEEDQELCTILKEEVNVTVQNVPDNDFYDKEYIESEKTTEDNGEQMYCYPNRDLTTKMKTEFFGTVSIRNAELYSVWKDNLKSSYKQQHIAIRDFLVAAIKSNVTEKHAEDLLKKAETWCTNMQRRWKKVGGREQNLKRRFAKWFKEGTVIQTNEIEILLLEAGMLAHKEGNSNLSAVLKRSASSPQRVSEICETLQMIDNDVKPPKRIFSCFCHRKLVKI